MREITLEELLEAGCHFGHQVTRSNPKARDFIFEARDNIHIIDLGKTKEWLEEALMFVKNLATDKNSTFLIVGTKRQARGIVEAQVKRASGEIKDPLNRGGLMYVTNRWIGGILTNFQEVSKNVKKLHDLEDLLKSEDAKTRYTKKELGLFEKEKQKLMQFYGGIADIKDVPTALFIIDSKLEDLAVREAYKTNTETVAIVDTNADPNVVTYPIPANDDAVGSIELITSLVVDSWIEGRNSVKETEEKVKAPEPKAAPKVEPEESSKAKVEKSPKAKAKSVTSSPKKATKTDTTKKK